MKSSLLHTSNKLGHMHALLAFALLCLSAAAQAAGTSAGTDITNIAKLSYSVSGTAQEEICSSPSGNSAGNGATTGTSCTDGTNGAGNTTFKVDNKIDVLVTGGNTVTTGVVPGAQSVQTTFTVKNEGNETQDFKLDIVSSITGDDFDPASCTVSSIVIADGTMGTYTANDQHINALTPDSVATVTVTCNIPDTASNTEDAFIGLTATAKTNDGANTLGGNLTETTTPTDGVDIVFADSAGTDDAARDAAHSDRNTYTVTTAVISVQKTVTTICDPLNGTTTPKNIPGALVRYSITISNGADAAPATLSQISDVLNAYLTFDGDFETGNSAANCTAAADVPTSLAGKGFRVTCGGASNSRACVTTPQYFTTGTGDDAIVNSSGTISVNFNGGSVTGTLGAALPAEGTYAAGELKADESVTIEFQGFIN